MSQKLAGYGQWTYRGAWALEIAAAAIGLTIGLALGYQAFSAGESATMMDLILASAPFFMIALAELTKIPIATLLFGASWKWKPLILAFLLILAGITFETVFMGLERAGTLRQLRYEELASQIDVRKQEAAQLAVSDELALKSDRVAQATAEYEKTTTLGKQALDAIQTQISELDTQLQGTAALTPEAARVRGQITDKEDRRDALIEQRDREAKEAVEQFERQRDSFNERIKLAREADDNDSARRLEAEVAKLANPRPAILAKFDQQIAAIEKEIAPIRSEFDRLRASSPAMTEEQQLLLERRAKLQENLDKTSESWQRRIDEANSRLADALATAERQAQTLSENRDRQDQIAKEIAALEKERIPMARTDQVRRIAGRWYGKKPEDVTEAEAGTVSVIWFGSIALIAALAGPITAIAALGLQRIAAQAESRSESRLSRLLRRILLTWRWRRVRTINVPVEVPVEKEVEKRIEVPVEKLVKEILYVPILTDDPDAVRRALDTDLPSEVADLVKISAKRGRKRASPA